MKFITSRENEIIKYAKAVRVGKIRTAIFVEGVRLCEEAVHAKLNVTQILLNEKDVTDERITKLTNELTEKIVIVSEKVFESLSETKSSQGIILITDRPTYNHEILCKTLPQNPLLVMLHRTNNPSNAGAIIRVAEAAGVCGVIATKGSTYLFAPKALRGSMGSSFRLPIWSNVSFEEAISWCRNRQITTICADAKSNIKYTEFDWNKPSALILGEEGYGLSEEEIQKADVAIKIEMKPPVESLNVAVAAGILLYEASNQRAKKPS